MRIALFADVHANLPALTAVLDHARSQHVDECWNLGDMVGYGPFPNETIELLRENCSLHIFGNHDVKSLDLERIEKMRVRDKDQDKVFSFAWTNKALNEKSRRFIEDLTEKVSVSVGQKKVLVTHGSPEGLEDGLTPITPPGRFRELAKAVSENVVLCGHTHQYFSREVDGVLFLNPGGVGRSFDGDPRAAYVVLEIVGTRVKVFPFRLEYDQNSLVQKMKDLGFPSRLINTFRQARSLEELDLPPSVPEEEALAAVLEFARTCHYEKEHARQVVSLSLQLFDALMAEHRLGLRERFLLQSAAFLHDIGLVYGTEGHHKSSRDMVLKADKLAFSEREKIIIALVARYHRKTLPESGHRYYEDLTPSDRACVDILSAILRVADGLDRTHRSVVKGLAVKVLSERIRLVLTASTDAGPEIEFARLKGDLFQKVFGKALDIKK